MDVEWGFHVILIGPNGRETIGFASIEVNGYQADGIGKMKIWAAYPYPLSKLQNNPNPIWGHGKTPEEAFKDLYFKLNPVMVEECNAENGVMRASISYRPNM